MDFQDFVIKIEPGESGEHKVLVLASPAGEGSGLFRVPFEFNPHILKCTLQRRTKRHLCLGDQPEVPGDPETLGNSLFRALFSGPVLQLYETSRRLLEASGPSGLRLRLHIDPERPGLENVCCLPWELLHEEGRGFLALCPQSLFSRHLDLPVPVRLVSLGRPLRVLVGIALPADVPFLGLDIERRTLESAWRGLEGVDLRFLRGATRESLRAALADEECHVLHFMGHGEVDRKVGEGGILLEGADGRSDFLAGSELVGLLASGSPPALVVLNACQTADGARAEDAFAGVAGAFVKAGAHSVVAMQAPISDRAALSFCKGLYRRLATGDPVDAAVVAGRRAILETPGTAGEWYIPVLFLRQRDGRIFDPVQVPEREKETAWRLARTLSGGQRERFLAALDPGGASGFEAMMDICEIAALRGGEDWLRCSEALLAVRSPLLVFGGPRQEWSPRPRPSWQAEGATIVGAGGDGGAVSCLTWEGLQFLDGFLEAQMDIPLLDLGGGAGLALRWSGGSAVLGILRGDPATGGARAEIVQQHWDGLSVLGSSAIPSSDTTWKVRLSVVGRRATLDVGGILVAVDFETEPMPGYAGLVRLDGALVHFGRPAVGGADLIPTRIPMQQGDLHENPAKMVRNRTHCSPRLRSARLPG